MHEFTTCKCAMLCIVLKTVRRSAAASASGGGEGRLQWLPLLGGKLNILAPPPLAAEYKQKTTKRADEHKVAAAGMARPRLNRSKIFSIELDLSTLLGTSLAGPHSGPISLHFCEVSELNAEDADAVLAGMGIRAVLDCGGADRLIPTPVGGAFGGKPVALSVGGGMPPWQLSQGRASSEGIDYKLFPYEDLKPSDAGAAAIMLQASLARGPAFKHLQTFSACAE
jgi:hypothetical protein